jgi:hypothetical protein
MTPEQPHFKSLVIRVGAEPSPIYLTARIVNHHKLRDGSGMYRVGCRFTGRLPDAAPAGNS